MSREHTKEWNRIGTITENWVETQYPNASAQTKWKYKNRMNMFLEFTGLTDAEFLEGFKRAKDRLVWRKQTGLKLVAFYKHRIKEGYATNTVRAEVSSVRAFCRDNADTLILPRRRIAKAKTAKGEHEFTREELAKMFYVADVRGKAVLATGISLGYSVTDFSELRRDFIESLVNKAKEEKIDFIGFNYERGKTGVESRSHLTPEAVNSLSAWFEYIDAYRAEKGLPKSEWCWCNGNGGHLNVQTINDIIKDLILKAQVITTGKVRFHLLRKFLMGALHDADFDSWEVKRVVGKEIPTSDDTYLQKLNRKISEKFPQVYDYIRLTGYASKNHTRIEDLEAKIQRMEIKMESMTIADLTLRRVIEYAIPKEKVKDAIQQLAKEYDIPTSKATNIDEFGKQLNQKLKEVFEAINEMQKEKGKEPAEHEYYEDGKEPLENPELIKQMLRKLKAEKA